MGEETRDSENKPQKKQRKRRKLLFSQIKQQVEFYFGDANLSKDRFLKKKSTEDKEGYVDISILTNFNKLKILSTDVAEIAKALSKSEHLEVSTDGLRVRRRNPLPENRKVDDRTVYVECLPATATHEWVRSVFSSCGAVAYVSLPKYHISRDIKGFAFVEYVDVESAQKACTELNNPPASAPQRPGWFPRGNRQMLHLEKRLTEHGVDVDAEIGGIAQSEEIKEGSSDRQSSEEPLAKRRIVDDSSSHDKLSGSANSDETSVSATAGVRVKRNKKNGDVALSKKEIPKSPLKKKRKADCSGEDESVSPKKVRINENIEVQVAEESDKKKRNRKRKRKDKKTDDLPELRVIPKEEWSKLKTEYLKLQKLSMQQLKHTLKQYKPPPRATHPNDAGKDTKPEVPKKQDTTPTFTPGVIAKIVSKSGMTRKLVKEAVSLVAETVYVDVIDGSEEGFIRCKDAENATKLVTAQVPGYNTSLIEGDAEKGYWDKILSDREKKLNSKTKTTKKRGRDKAIHQAEKINKEVNNSKHTFFIDQ